MQLSVTRSEVNGFDRSGARTIKDFPRGSDNNDASVRGPQMIMVMVNIRDHRLS